MSANEWVAFGVGVCTIATALLVALRWVIKSYLAELKPNSGTSIKDQVTRLEQRVDELFSLINRRQ
jgi:hypothetical protein